MIDPVDIYFNLHRGVWSLRSRRTGLVVRHARVVHAAYGARFVVRESGRQRVLATRRKNVHAFVRANEYDTSDSASAVTMWRGALATLESDGWVKVSYNPYRGATFYVCESGAPIHESCAVLMLAPEGESPQVWASLWIPPN